MNVFCANFFPPDFRLSNVWSDPFKHAALTNCKYLLEYAGGCEPCSVSAEVEDGGMQAKRRGVRDMLACTGGVNWRNERLMGNELQHWL